MLEGHRVLRLRCVGGGEVELEVNYSNNEKVKDCKIIKFKKDSVEFEIAKDELLTLMLVLGNESEMKQMLPMQLTKIKKMERLLTFDWVASQDYKKGDKITVKAPWIDTVPDVEEVLSGNIKKKKWNNPLKFFVK